MLWTLRCFVNCTDVPSLCVHVQDQSMTRPLQFRYYLKIDILPASVALLISSQFLTAWRHWNCGLLPGPLDLHSFYLDRLFQIPLCSHLFSLHWPSLGARRTELCSMSITKNAHMAIRKFQTAFKSLHVVKSQWLKIRVQIAHCDCTAAWKHHRKKSVTPL